MLNFQRYKILYSAVCILIYISSFLFLPYGCYSVKKTKQAEKIPESVKEKPDEEKHVLVWPLPPDEPRIQFIKSITTKKELGKIADRKAKKKAEGSVFRTIVYWSKFVFRVMVGLPTFLSEIFGGKKVEVGIKRPYGITVDELDRIYVADRDLGVVHMFDYDEGVYRQIIRAGTNIMVSPIGIAADNENNIYVSDSYLKKVFIYSMEGDFKGIIGNDYRFSRPTGLAINKELGLLYITDTHSHKIAVFSLDGDFQFEFGNKGSEEEKLHFPTNIFVDKDNFVYVCDSMNFRIKIYTGIGKLIGQFGKIGNKIGYFAKPKGVAVDSEGHIYQVESFFDRIQIFDKKGNLLLFFGHKGRGDGEFWLPSGIFIDKNDKIYVADDYNSRVQVFQYLSKAYKRRQRIKMSNEQLPVSKKYR